MSADYTGRKFSSLPAFRPGDPPQVFHHGTAASSLPVGLSQMRYAVFSAILLMVYLGGYAALASDLPQIDMAMISGDQQKVISLFCKGASIDGDMNDGTPFIIEATRRSLDQVTTYLIATGADVTRRDREARTALQVATRYKADQIVPILLATKKFDINSPDKEGRTPLFYASTNNPEIVTLLIEAGANPNKPTADSHKVTPLTRASDRGIYSTLPALIKGGAQISGGAGARAVDAASRYNTDNHAKAIVILADAGADLDGKPIWGCLEYRRYKCLSALLRGGADVNQRGVNDITPLIHAVMNGDVAAAKIILGHRPDFELKARFPFAFHGMTDVPKEERYNDATALMRASADGRLDLVKLLVESGAKTTTTDRHGRTALMMAEQTGRKEIVEYLKAK